MTQTTRDTLVAFIFAGLSLFLFLVLGGGAPQEAAQGIADPGAFVGWAVPFTKLIADISAVLGVGFLLAGGFFLPSDQDGIRGLSIRGVYLASRRAIVWAVSSVVYFFVSAAFLFAKPLND